MPTFDYEAVNTAGQSIKERIEAPSPQDALQAIRLKGYYPTRVTPTRTTNPKTKNSSGGKKATRGIAGISFGRVSTSVLADFTRQLATLQDAGLPLLRSLKILAQQEKRGLLKSALTDITTTVEDGSTLSQALAQQPRTFNRLYVNMIQAGETGGVLDVILTRLADFMEKSQKLRRRVIGAMIYPAAVITFSMLIVTGIMMFVVPKFQEIFRDFRTTLPVLTVALMTTADVIAHHYGWTLILGSPLLLVLSHKLLTRSLGGRYALDALKLRLPVVGKIFRKSAVSRFARTLGTLLAAGVPILEAITIARDTVGNIVFERALQKVHDAIREGEPFATPLRQTRVCDPIVTNMIDVGEETGDLDKMLLKIADNYDDQIDTLVASLVSLLEPIMVIVLGGIVGTIVLALFLPIMELLKTFT